MPTISNPELLSSRSRALSLADGCMGVSGVSFLVLLFKTTHSDFYKQCMHAVCLTSKKRGPRSSSGPQSHALHLPQEGHGHRGSKSPTSQLLRALLHLAGEPPAAPVPPHSWVVRQSGDGHGNHQEAGAGALHAGACLPSSFPTPPLRGPGDASAPGSSEYLPLPPSPHWGCGSSSEAHPLLPAPATSSPRTPIPGLRTRKDGDLPGAPFLTPLCPLLRLNFSALLKCS